MFLSLNREYTGSNSTSLDYISLDTHTYPNRIHFHLYFCANQHFSFTHHRSRPVAHIFFIWTERNLEKVSSHLSWQPYLI